MTREEYMAKLQKYLRKLPKQDYEDAIDYFNEYFSDTDEEGQQKLMEELGTPKEAAADLMCNLLDRKLQEQDTDIEEKNSKKGIGKLLLRGLVSFPYSLSGALTVTGCGLFGIGCAILLYILGIYLCKWTGMLLVKLAQVLAGKRGKNHEKNK